MPIECDLRMAIIIIDSPSDVDAAATATESSPTFEVVGKFASILFIWLGTTKDDEPTIVRV